MNKQIAHVPLEQISRLEIVVTKCRKSLTEVKGETGADYILNGGMWNPDGSCTVKMGKETDVEKLLVLLYGGDK